MNKAQYDALPHVLTIERARQFRRRYRTFTFIQHLDVTAQRYRGQHPLGAIGTAHPGAQRLAEADRKAQDFDIAPARHPIMS
jgi:hypothetical protein